MSLQSQSPLAENNPLQLNLSLNLSILPSALSLDLNSNLNPMGTLSLGHSTNSQVLFLIIELYSSVIVVTHSSC